METTRKQVGGQVTLAEVETRGYSKLAGEANPASTANGNRRPLRDRDEIAYISNYLK